MKKHPLLPRQQHRNVAVYLVEIAHTCDKSLTRFFQMSHEKKLVIMILNCHDYITCTLFDRDCYNPV